MTKLSELKKQWMKDPKLKKHYDELGVEFDIAREFIKARIQAHMTQKEVAEAMKTTQSVIARLESGKTMPSIRTLNRFAKVVGMRPEIHFVPVEG